jgi:chromate transporter
MTPRHPSLQAVDAPKASRISLWHLIALHLRVGNLTFGGGDPSMAALHAEMVGTRRWLTADRYATVFALARVTPGTNLLAFCAGVSWHLMGWAGAIAAVLSMTVPAAIAVVILTQSYAALQAHPIAVAAIGGVVASAVGMMPAAAWQLARPYFYGARWLHATIIVGAAFVLSAGVHVSPILILAVAAALGCIWRIPE